MLKAIDRFFFPAESNEMELKEKAWFYVPLLLMPVIALSTFIFI